MLHGGPGAGHEYLLPFAYLWEQYGLPVVLYDQIGCGKSSRLKEMDGDTSFWTVHIFVSELENVLNHIKLNQHPGPGYHLLGQSWGGVIATQLAIKCPKALQRVVLASAIARQQLALEGYRLEARLLSKEDQDAIDGSAASGCYDLTGYKDAMDHFRRTFMCRSDQYPPPELLPAFQNLSNSTIWKTMWVSSYPFLLSFLVALLMMVNRVQLTIRRMGESLYDPSKGVLAN